MDTKYSTPDCVGLGLANNDSSSWLSSFMSSSYTHKSTADALFAIS